MKPEEAMRDTLGVQVAGPAILIVGFNSEINIESVARQFTLSWTVIEYHPGWLTEVVEDVSPFDQ